jgi:hypothetical protein
VGSARLRRDGDEAVNGHAERLATQWTAQFAVASLLAGTVMNCIHIGKHNSGGRSHGSIPFKQEEFPRRCEGPTNAEFLESQKTVTLRDLFYVFAHAPWKPGKSSQRTADRFFVLTQKETNDLIEDWLRTCPNPNPDDPGFNWTAPHPFENKWPILPDWPQ